MFKVSSGYLLCNIRYHIHAPGYTNTNKQLNILVIRKHPFDQ